jgi:flagella basal body P-ring formation protein FlgA
MMLYALMIILALASGASCSCLEVAGPFVRAGELARVATAFSVLPPDQEVLPSPRPGVQRTLTALEVERLAAGAGLPPGPQPALCVERGARPIDPDALLTALRQAWIAAGGSADATIELTGYVKLRVPEGRLEFGPPPAAVAEACRANLPVTWRGRLRYDRNQSVPVWASANIRSPRTVLVFRRDLAAGALLSSEDIRPETVPCGLPQDSAPAEATDVTGRQLRAAVREGQLVRPQLLAALREIARGDHVEVGIAGLDHVLIRAVAVTGGRQGERVVLENPLNKARFQANVTGPKRALIPKENANASRE